MRIPFWAPSLWIAAALIGQPQHPWLALVGYHGLCLIASLDRRAWAPGRVDRIGLAWITAALPLVLLAWLLPPLTIFPKAQLSTLMGRLPGGLNGQILYALIVNVPVEEAYWRGALRREKARWSLLQHGCAFGLHHAVAAAILLPWPWVLPAFLLPGLAGAGWSWFARRNGGIAVPYLLHAVADLSLLILVACQLKAPL